MTGYVDVQVTGNIYVTYLTTGDSNNGLDILLKAGGNIYIDELYANAAGTVTLAAGNNILETSPDAGVDITATTLTADAGVNVTVEGIRTVSATNGGSIQGPSDDLVLETAVDYLLARAATGSIYIDEQDALILTRNPQIAGTLSLTTGGNLTITTWVSAGTAINLNVGGQLTQNSGNKLVTNALDITTPNAVNVNTRVNSLSVTITGTGDLSITEDNDLNLSNITTANGNVSITAGASSLGDMYIGSIVSAGSVTLVNQRGAINDADDDLIVDIIAGSKQLSSPLRMKLVAGPSPGLPLIHSANWNWLVAQCSMSR